MRQDLTDGRGLKSQIAVDEYRTIEIGLGEAVGLGAQLAMNGALGDA